MQALLDTHVFLWWNTKNPKLSPKAKSFLQNQDNTIFFSAASAWEIVIKYQIGKLPLPETPQSYIPTRINHYDFKTLSIELSHTLKIADLDALHNDPFDRLLIAQSLVEDLPLITGDQKIHAYKIPIIW